MDCHYIIVVYIFPHEWPVTMSTRWPLPILVYGASRITYFMAFLCQKFWLCNLAFKN